MTFTEAAAKVLRLVGKPLHYKEITDVAIEKNFLSHVGKSPEVTMGARLAALVKKGEKDNPLVRIKPGVFALRDWDEATISKGLQDRTPAIERIGEEPLSAEASLATVATVIDDLPEPDEEERRRAQFAAGAQQLFSTEDDDEEPILGSADEPQQEGEEGEDGARRRRRRRRRGRGDDEHTGLPSYTVSDAPLETLALEATGEGAAAPQAALEPRGRREPSRRDESRREDNRREDNRRDEVRRDEARGDARKEEALAPGEELGGTELADFLEQLLVAKGRGPLSLKAVAEVAAKKGRVEEATAEFVVTAAVRADNARRVFEGGRARFRVQAGRVALLDFRDGELARLDRELGGLVRRYREATRRSLLRSLAQVPGKALGELLVLALEAAQVHGIKPLRRAGIPAGELHYTGKLKSTTGELQLGIVFRREGREVGRERVAELRGALHHYGPAQAGMIVTLGQVLSGAREEASATGAAPVHLVDGAALSRLFEQAELGVQRLKLELPMLDLELFESLRSG